MKPVTSSLNRFSEHIKTKPWLLVVLLCVFFYFVLPTPHKRPSFVRDVYRLMPSEAQAELTQFEPGLSKFISSVALATLAVVTVQTVRSRRQSFED